MPTSRFQDLPSSARTYVAFVVIAGTAAIVDSVVRLHIDHIGWTWTILALLTLVSGSATVNLPGLPATVSVSETFVFTSVLFFGPAPGTLTVALDALVISIWSYRKAYPRYKILFNVCVVALTLWVGSHIYYSLSPYRPLYLAQQAVQVRLILLPLLAFTIAYYGINTWGVALAISLERRLPPLQVWRDNFVWLALNYFGGASVAALLISYSHDLDFTYLLIIVPLLAVLYFTFSMSMGRAEDANRHLSELNRLYMSTIETLAMAIDAKDQITHGHIRRVQAYAVGLAKAVGVTDDAQIRAIEAASLLHDMGKLAVPEYILNKPGPLTPAEFEKMKLHASVGADILSAIEFPYPVVPIVRHHHENWDGSGYPAGLKGAEIPVGARVLSVVDCFDALTSDRPYRPRLTDKDALNILQSRRGTMYDPLMVDTFLQVHSQIAPSPEQAASVSSLRAISSLASTSPDLLPQDIRLDEISASTDEMLTLFDLARSLSPTMRVSDIGDIISKHLRRLIPSSLSVFYVLDERSDELIAAHVSGEHASLVAGLRIARGQRLSGWVAATRQTIRNSDPVLDFGESARSMTPRPRSCLSAALVNNADLVGVLTLYSSHKDGFTSEHERILEIVTKQVTPSIRHALEFEAQRAESLRDQLTGLPKMEEFFHFSKSAQHGSATIAPATLLLIDVDNLSTINEQFGRRAGDAALGKVVDAAKKALRPSDVLFRDEDDQFIVLLLHTQEETSRILATRIRESVATLGFEGFSLSVTIAAATAPADAETFEALLSKARERLLPPSDSRNSNTERIH